VIGGSPPYQFAWAHGPTTEDVNNLGVGDYSVSVTDANGCIVLGAASINMPQAVSATINSNSPVCSNSLGALEVIAAGGVAPYSYQWSFGATTRSVIDIPTGAHSITITDAVGCTAVATTTIVELAPVQVKTIATKAGCSGKGGDIRVTIENGMPPFVYKWSHGATTQNLTNVPAGQYEGIVTDANGCAGLMIATVESSANLEATAQTIPPTCFGAPNGAIQATISSGTAPFKYKWNTGATTEDLIKVKAGNYQLTITDAQDCEFVLNTTLIEPKEILISQQTQTKALCDLSNGSITVKAEGGKEPYNYLWSTGATGSRLSNIPLGTYPVTVTDNNGCSQSQSLTLESECTCPEALYTNIMVNPSNCGNRDGRIMIMVDQIERYTFEWLPNVGIAGAFQNERSGLPSGDYRIRVTYAGQRQCSEIVEIFLGNNEAIATQVIVNQPAACEKVNGQVELSPKETIYTWEDGIVSHRRTDLAAGTYRIMAMDVNGCMQEVTVVVGQEACISCEVNATIEIAKVPTCDFKRASLVVNTTGGKAPYTYQWSTATIGNTSKPTNLPIDQYQVTVTDRDNCTATAAITLSSPTCTSTCDVSASIITTDIKCAGTAEGVATVRVIDGKAPFTYAWSNGSNQPSIQNLLAGSYAVTVTDAKGCSVVEVVAIQENTTIQADFVTNFYSCEKVAIQLSIQGGQGPYKWLCNGQEGTTNEAIILPIGQYPCTIMDKNWCSTEIILGVDLILDERCNPIIIDTTQTIEEDTIPTSPTEIPNFSFETFTAKGNGIFVQLAWSTLNEVLEGQFQIKHSRDSVTYRVISNSIIAHGPITSADYHVTLEVPFYGKNYFQIQYFDANGTITQSSVQEIFREAEGAARVVLYPNPVRSQFTVDFLRPTTQSAVLTVTDNLGNPIDRLDVARGTTILSLDTGEYQPGLYFLTLDQGILKSTTLRLVKIEE